MSTVEERVYSLLIANSGVTALVPAERIKVPGDWQGLALPYIVHFPVTAEATNAHDGPQVLRIWREYQVSVFATTYGEARAVMDAVETALDGHRDSATNRVALVRPPLPMDDYDGDRKLAHIAAGFQIAGALK